MKGQIKNTINKKKEQTSHKSHAELKAKEYKF